MSQTMLAKHSISAKMAECYITIKGNCYQAMNAINLEVTFEKSKSEVPILGRMNKGHKSTGSSITGNAEFHFNTSIWRQLAYIFQETGEDLYFDILVKNYDTTASDIGSQSILLKGCNFDSVLLAKFDADTDDSLTETLDFTVESFAFANNETFNPIGGLSLTSGATTQSLKDIINDSIGYTTNN